MAPERALAEMIEPGAVQAALGEGIRTALAAAADARPGRVLRVETPVNPVDVLGWLQAQRGDAKVYWRDRAREFEAAGVGEADVVHYSAPPDVSDVFDRLRGGLGPASPNIRYYGGFAFSAAQPDARWGALGYCRFVLPRWELLCKQDEAILACNIRLGAESAGALADSLCAEAKGLAFPTARPESGPLPHIVSRSDSPGFEEWAGTVGEALAAIERGVLRKVVLARASCFAFDDTPDPLELLRRLQLDCTRSFGFLIQPEAGTAFLGASPERLYKRQSCYIQTEAIAGTRRRGATPEEDYTLGEQLLKSDKDRREHRFVVDSLQAVLEERCRAVQSSRDPALLKLRRCQHLFQALEGILNDGYSDGQVLQAIHPTPAVGGAPTQEALAWLTAHEPFNRWWYAGPVGWVSYDAAEFVVAIRSGLAFERSLCLYTGAGIVPGSVAEEEWDELENKMDNFMAILKDA